MFSRSKDCSSTVGCGQVAFWAPSNWIDGANSCRERRSSNIGAKGVFAKCPPVRSYSVLSGVSSPFWPPVRNNGWIREGSSASNLSRPCASSKQDELFGVETGEKSEERPGPSGA